MFEILETVIMQSGLSNTIRYIPEEDKSDCWCLLVKTIKERTEDADYVERVRNLVDQGQPAEPNRDAVIRHNHDFPPCHDQSPLCTALHVGAVDVVSLLLTRGADPMDPTSQKRFGAALDPDMIEVMETHGIDYHINPTDKFMMGLLGPLDARDKDYGQSAFDPEKQMKKIKKLFEKGMKVDRVNTRLHPNFSIVTHLLKVAPVMTEEHRYNLVQLFLESGADVNIPDRNGKTPLHHAASQQQHRIIKLLFDHGAHVNAHDKCKFTPLQMLLNGSNEQDDSSLHSVVLHFIKHGANFELCDYSGRTALHYAAQKQLYKVCELLMDHGAKVDVMDAFGATPFLRLMTSAFGSDERLCKIAMLFIEKGANIERIYFNIGFGTTALHHSAKKGLYKVCTLLLDHGADPNKKDNLRGTPLLDFLEASNASDDDLHKLAKLFIQHGANVRAVRDNGKSALHIAARKGLYKVSKLLIDHGADINVEDNARMTPILDLVNSIFDLHLVKLFDFLVQKGADINKKVSKTDVPEILMIGFHTSRLESLLFYILDKHCIEVPPNLTYYSLQHPSTMFKLVQVGVTNASVLQQILNFAIETQNYQGYDLVRIVNPYDFKRPFMRIIKSRSTNHGTDRDRQDFRRRIRNDLSVPCLLTTCCVFAIRYRMLEIRRNNISILPGLRQLSAVLPPVLGRLITLDCFMLDFR